MTVTKTLKIEFGESLPIGTRGTFTYEKQQWLAYPAAKQSAIFALCDRLIGLHARITKDAVNMINQRPADAALVAIILERTAVARQLTNELIIEKGKVFTQ